MDTSEYLGLFLDEARDSLRLLDAAMLDLERDPGDRDTLAAVFRIAHNLKGMSATVGLDEIADLAHRMEDVLAALRDARARAEAPVRDALLACRDALGRMVDGAAGGGAADIDAVELVARLERAVAGARGGAAAPRRAVDLLEGGPHTGAPRTVRVGVDRLDALADLVTGLAAGRERLAELARAGDLEGLGREIAAMTGAVEDLSALAAGIRMTPVEAVFMRFPRMVRDLAQSLGKLVDLRIDGGDITIDRAVADHLGEPLVHALRNAIDHGLEEPGERVAAGKGAVGVLRLAARRAGARVEIEVRDDGRGMDPQALRASAVRAGRMDVASALALPDADALRLVFLPGLSTARTITAISGRGVGMDAVLAAVEALGGEVAVASAPGEGSAITFSLPLAQPWPPT